MAVIKAFAGALGGTFADLWRDIITAGPFTEHTVVVPGIPRGSNNDRGSNEYGSEGIITNGSRIYVPENTAAFIFSETGIENVITESGGYEYRNGEQSVLAGDGIGSFINQVAGRKGAKAENRPGVTRGKQWINIDQGLDLLDTPGILWPKFDSQEVGEMLAITNAIKADVLDKETLGANFMLRLRELYPKAIEERYKFVPDPDMNGFELLEQAAKKRGFLVSRGEYDIERMANTLLGEYHDGKLGRLTLEAPPDA